jgi:hypothetical protein
LVRNFCLRSCAGGSEVFSGSATSFNLSRVFIVLLLCISLDNSVWLIGEKVDRKMTGG